MEIDYKRINFTKEEVEVMNECEPWRNLVLGSPEYKKNKALVDSENKLKEYANNDDPYEDIVVKVLEEMVCSVIGISLGIVLAKSVMYFIF
jgi:hypothetical protein